MGVLVRYSRMAGTFLRLGFLVSMEYRTYFFAWLVSNPLSYIFGLISLRVVVSQFQPLGGWGFEQLAFLYGMGIISHALSVIFFVQTWFMGSLVTQGEFDRMLLRPLSIPFQFCFSRLTIGCISDLIPGIVIFIYGCAAVAFQLTLSSIASLLLALIGATLLRAGIYFITGSIAFWTKRGMTDIAFNIFDLSIRYPMSIYPKAIQFLLTFLIPVGFIAFYPASQLLNMQTDTFLPWSLCMWTFFIGVIIYILGMLVFKAGLKRYESAGS